MNKAILDDAQRTASVVAAVLVGRNGGKKIVIMDIENGDGCGIDAVKEYVDEIQHLVKPREKLLTVQFKGLSVRGLEQIATHVKVID